MPSAYERAGLTRNPFVADGQDLTLVIDRDIELPPAGFVQVAGERGAGKTTLLKQWQQVHGGTYHYVEHGRARWRPVPLRTPIVFWDEADRLPRVVVRRALRAARLGSIRVVDRHSDSSLQSGHSRLSCMSPRPSWSSYSFYGDDSETPQRVGRRP